MKISFSTMGGVFVVPNQVDDNLIKNASAYQLRVLLYILKNSDKNLTYEEIGRSIDIMPSDVKDSMELWIKEGVITVSEDTVNSTPTKVTHNVTPAVKVNVSGELPIKSEVPKKIIPTRATRPDSTYVAQRITTDNELSDFISEVELIFQKPLSSGDLSVLVMLRDSFGLPCSVLLMLIQYCASLGKCNIRYIEKLGEDWSDKEIFTVQLADDMIKYLANRNSAWGRVSNLFGINNSGKPSKKQVDIADSWVNVWSIPDELLLEAYEKCVDKKGEFNLSYTNGIVKKWHEKGINSLEELKSSESKQKSKKDKNKSSYDVSEYEDFSIFDK